MRLMQRAGTFSVILLLSVACQLLISRFFLQSFEVDGVSMAPTLDNHAHYFLNRWAFHQESPQRGDVVVLRDPEVSGLAVKRIVALPGESIHFKNGAVYVNGRKLDESYLPARTYTFTYSRAHEQFITCGRDQYFVLGDNRPMSIDSRAYGAVPRGNILGRVIMKHQATELQHASVKASETSSQSY